MIFSTVVMHFPCKLTSSTYAKIWSATFSFNPSYFSWSVRSDGIFKTNWKARRINNYEEEMRQRISMCMDITLGLFHDKSILIIQTTGCTVYHESVCTVFRQAVGIAKQERPIFRRSIFPLKYDLSSIGLEFRNINITFWRKKNSFRHMAKLSRIKRNVLTNTFSALMDIWKSYSCCLLLVCLKSKGHKDWNRVMGQTTTSDEAAGRQKLQLTYSHNYELCGPYHWPVWNVCKTFCLKSF
jgi:hypothetical protein